MTNIEDKQFSYKEAIAFLGNNRMDYELKHMIKANSSGIGAFMGGQEARDIVNASKAILKHKKQFK